MGPVMNLLLAFVLTAVVLYHGAEVASYEDQPAVVGVRRAAARRPPRADIEPGDRIVSVADHRVDTWEEFFITDRRAAEPRDLDRPAAQRPRHHAQGDAGRRAGPEPVRDRRHRRAAERAPAPASRQRRRAGRARRPQGRRRHLAVDGKPITFHTEFREAIAKHPDKPMTRVDPARRQRR